MAPGRCSAPLHSDLIPDAETMQPLMVALWLMVGAGVFVGLDALVEKNFGEKAGAVGIVLRDRSLMACRSV